ncbi:hypothetical protein DHEL01_v203786 [Diaporthe helianthi]|uniref:Uncharacterized protein n=1 Tax=Diaporthe helianthi TaxID=158607 RepID=A0A2P5I5P1_DIAHE|nr:hypothetical protein DHEL01_v203786 [Diaporthe helianthi]
MQQARSGSGRYVSLACTTDWTVKDCLYFCLSIARPAGAGLSGLSGLSPCLPVKFIGPPQHGSQDTSQHDSGGCFPMAAELLTGQCFLATTQIPAPTDFEDAVTHNNSMRFPPTRTLQCCKALMSLAAWLALAGLEAKVSRESCIARPTAL